MKSHLYKTVCLLCLIGSCCASRPSGSLEWQPVEPAQTSGPDEATPLISRVNATPASVLKMFEELGGPPPTPHSLTRSERDQLSTAFANLPPLHRKILSEHLRTVSFLDGMPNTALTSTVNPGEPFRLFDITIRAPILKQSASEWLTEKEQTCFQSSGSALSVSIEAGKRDAIDYVILHEATHIVDAFLGITTSQPPTDQPVVGPPSLPFVKDIWAGRGIPAERYHDPLREQIRFRPGGKVLAMDQAETVYRSLEKTPFTSLYGSSNWYEDLAEYVAVYHWSKVLRQPFKIVLRQGNRVVYKYEPMKSPLVLTRSGQMQQFYKSREPK